jgi:hypothetical protein
MMRRLLVLLALAVPLAPARAQVPQPMPQAKLPEPPRVDRSSAAPYAVALLCSLAVLVVICKPGRKAQAPPSE